MAKAVVEVATTLLQVVVAAAAAAIVIGDDGNGNGHGTLGYWIWRPDCCGGKQPRDVVSQKPNSRIVVCG